MNKDVIEYIDHKVLAREKRQKRLELRYYQISNIKKAIRIILVILIIFGVGNHFYKQYQEKIYADKRTIMNINSNNTTRVTNEIYYVSRIITNLLYGQEEKISRSSDALYQLSGEMSYMFEFHYSRDDYNIDDWVAREYVSGMIRAVAQAREKEFLSEEDKAHLALILETNRNILSELNTISDLFKETDHYEELRYLYYYKGEAYYLLVNAIDVHSADVDIYYFEEEVSHEREEEVFAYSEAEAKELASLFNDIVFSNAYNLDGAIKQYEHSFDHNTDQVYAIEYEVGNNTYNEVIYASLNGDMFYRNEGSESQLKTYKNILPDEELRSIADGYIVGFEEPLLKYDDVFLSEYKDDSGRKTSRHVYSYRIIDDHYQSTEVYVQVGLYGNGSLYSVQVYGPELLKKNYVKESVGMTEEEAALLVNESGLKQIRDITYESNNDYGLYVVSFIDYGINFKAYIDPKSREIVYIEMQIP